MKFTTALTTLFAASAAFVGAVPVQKRDVWDPTVLYPHTGTVWTLGATHNVTWDTSDAPTNISNGAAVYLRKGNSTLVSNGPLAEGFDLRVGRIEVTVPTNITPGVDYRVVLFGDSGNWGPLFTITS